MLTEVKYNKKVLYKNIIIFYKNAQNWNYIPVNIVTLTIPFSHKITK
jgi:hypothetical protein